MGTAKRSWGLLHPPSVTCPSSSGATWGTFSLCDPGPGLQIRFFLASQGLSRAALASGGLVPTPSEPSCTSTCWGDQTRKAHRGCGRRQGSAGLELEPVRASQPTDAGWPGASVSLL